MAANIALPESVRSMSGTEAKVALQRKRQQVSMRRRAAKSDAANVAGGVTGVALGILVNQLPKIPLPGGRTLPLNTVAGAIGLIMIFTDNPMTRSAGRVFFQAMLFGMGTVDAVQWTGKRLAGVGQMFGS